MATITTKRTVKTASCKAAAKTKKPKKLSKVGKWMRAHPKGDVEILDWDAVLR